MLLTLLSQLYSYTYHWHRHLWPQLLLIRKGSRVSLSEELWNTIVVGHTKNEAIINNPTKIQQDTTLKPAGLQWYCRDHLWHGSVLYCTSTFDEQQTNYNTCTWVKSAGLAAKLVTVGSNSHLFIDSWNADVLWHSTHPTNIPLTLFLTYIFMLTKE